MWHARSAWQITEKSAFQLLLENITDVDYRVRSGGAITSYHRLESRGRPKISKYSPGRK